MCPTWPGVLGNAGFKRACFRNFMGTTRAVPLVGFTGVVDWEGAAMRGLAEDIPPGDDLFSHSVTRAVS